MLAGVCSSKYDTTEKLPIVQATDRAVQAKDLRPTLFGTIYVVVTGSTLHMVMKFSLSPINTCKLFWVSLELDIVNIIGAQGGGYSISLNGSHMLFI